MSCIDPMMEIRYKPQFIINPMWCKRKTSKKLSFFHSFQNFKSHFMFVALIIHLFNPLIKHSPLRKDLGCHSFQGSVF